VLNTVSVQYLQYPEAIFAEIHRILKVGGIAIVSFSNRMFYQKAIQAWRDGEASDRTKLVFKYFASVPKGFTHPELVANVPPNSPFLAMFGMASSDPFYAVVATRCEI
jgi:hypothetical protein